MVNKTKQNRTTQKHSKQNKTKHTKQQLPTTNQCCYNKKKR